MVSIGDIQSKLSIISFLYKYWYIWLAIVLILPTIVYSIKDAREQNDYSLILKNVASLMTNSDKEIYDYFYTLNIEKGELRTTSEKFDYYSKLIWIIFIHAIVPLYFICFIYWIFYKIIVFLTGDVSKLGSSILSLIVIGIIQIAVNKVPFIGVYTAITKIWNLI